MTVFNLLNQNRQELVLLKRNNIISATVFQHMNIYKDFKAMDQPKMERYETLSKEYNLSPRTIRDIINKLAKAAK